MQWLQINVSIDREAIEAVSEMLLRHGFNGVEIDDPHLIVERNSQKGDWDYLELPEVYDPEAEVTIRCWLNAVDEVDSLIMTLRDELALMPSYGVKLGSGQLDVTEIENQDWAEAWKAYFKPFRVGENLIVKPAWEIWEGEQDLIIELDPGLAFGTGDHPTTQMCLELIEQHLIPGSRVIDVGCGSGILSIAALLLGADFAEAIDVDPLAVESATANLELNKLSAKALVQQADLLQYSEATNHIALVNIVADVIIRLLPELKRVLFPGGKVILGGIIEERFPEIEQALLGNGYTLLEARKRDGWVSAAAIYSIS